MASGGGIVINAENCAPLKSRGKVIYLHAKPDNLAKRMKHDKVRPFLQLATEDFIVDTEHQKKMILNKIESLLTP